MKLIILAAGSGSRLKKFSDSPKPLIKVKGKPMIWWSLKSFHDVLTQGLLTKNDIKIAIQKSQLTEFLDSIEIRDFFGDINPFILIESLTSGPGETGLMVVNRLLQDQSISINEKIVFSDADHFIWSPNIYRNLMVDSNILLWQAKKDESLDWCFVVTENDRTFLLEKPSRIENFDLYSGIVGIYGFKTVELFINAANKIFLTNLNCNSDEEFFMSSVVNMALQDNYSVSLSFVKFFVPLGNSIQIVNATKLPEPDLFIYDPPTYFIDIDGVIFNHNYNIRSSKVESEDILLSLNAQVINERFLDGMVIFVSSRPIKYFNYIESTLKSNGVNFDRLILGCTGGIRWIINDLKPDKEYTETAIALNSERNGLLNLEEPEIPISELTGGSNARTLLVTQGNKFIVKKFAIKKEDIDIIKNQCRWYVYVKKFIGEDIATLKVLGEVENSEQYVLKTEYEPSLISLYEWCSNETVSDNQNSNFQNKVVETNYSQVELNLALPLIEESFGKLYERSIVSNGHIGTEILPRIIKEKVIPSLDKTLDLFAKCGEINENLLELRKQMQTLLSSKKISQYSFKGAIACIHGDPTFSNLQVSFKDSKIVFTDPVGAAIEAGYDFSKFRAESYPVFDLARLELSFKYQYEFNEKLIETNNLSDEEVESIVLLTFNRPSISQFLSNTTFLPFDVKNLDLVVATSMLRILKYKKDKTEIKLLALQARKILDNLM